MKKEIYKIIAEKYGVNTESVEEEIKKAIIEMYKNPNALALQVPRKNNIPTVDELIDFIIKNITH